MIHAAPISTATAGDYIRQSLNLVGAPMMWICSSLGFFWPGARSPSDFSDITPNILVPWTPAFSIWFPIFLGCIAYGFIQAFPRNRTRPVFRQTGWWVAVGFWLVCLWGVVTSFAPIAHVELAASIIFIPAMVALVVAMIKLSRAKTVLSASEQWLVLTPISLIAGWCSLAVFVGWNAVIFDAVRDGGWSMTGTALMVLSWALGWAILVLRRGASNRIYAFPIIWGLTFLAIRHLVQDGGTAIIGATAFVGIIAVAIAAVWKIRKPATA